VILWYNTSNIKGGVMQTLTINIKNSGLTEKVMWLLEHFKKDGLEIIETHNIGSKGLDDNYDQNKAYFNKIYKEIKDGKIEMINNEEANQEIELFINQL
jgi:predicted nuclease with RNAse H fold